MIDSKFPATKARLRRTADALQPVIIALNVAGLTGGAIAAAGLLAHRTWRRRPATRA